MYGISSFSAVINPPQACILAVGAGIQKVLPPKAGAPLKEGASPRPRVVTTVTVQLSADRRVVDEATAAQFLQVSHLPNLQPMLCIDISLFIFFRLKCNRFFKAT